MTRSTLFLRLSERRLRAILALFFLALAVPALLLVRHAYSQLNWQSYRQTQLLAQDLTVRLDTDLAALIRSEEARSSGDYAFLVVEGDPAAGFVQRSPLSAMPADSTLPGALGYFQVNAAGEMSTPLLPPQDVDPLAYGISPDERVRRVAAESSVREVLALNSLLPVQLGFDQITRSRTAAGQIPPPRDELQTADTAQVDERARRQETSMQAGSRLVRNVDTRTSRLEQAAVPERTAPAADSLDVRMFTSEVDPFESALLESGHLMLFRRVWRDDGRVIQGILIDTQAFLTATVEPAFRASSLSDSGALAVNWERDPVTRFASSDRYGSSGDRADAESVPLYQARLSSPFSSFELVYTLRDLPRGPGGSLLGWVAFALLAVLSVGFVLMYQFAVGQARLARQQQDFVSAVSHELKTPLTSIRMYGEMLKAGWADEARRKTYYDYIHAESERLSRLIDNVLQLARMTRRQYAMSTETVPVTELADMVRSKVASQVAHAGFELVVTVQAECETLAVRVDRDAFAQIMINLVDNALKFAVNAATKSVEIGCRLDADHAVFTVRDYGPGVPRAQMRKIFELFYRPDEVLTRETPGTGIGLALVRQLADAMDARVDVRNREPGAQFSVRLPAVRRVPAD